MIYSVQMVVGGDLQHHGGDAAAGRGMRDLIPYTQQVVHSSSFLPTTWMDLTPRRPRCSILFTSKIRMYSDKSNEKSNGGPFARKQRRVTSTAETQGEYPNHAACERKQQTVLARASKQIKGKAYLSLTRLRCKRTRRIIMYHQVPPVAHHEIILQKP